MKFWMQIRVTESGCWEWTGKRYQKTAYGRLGHSRFGSAKAHRAAYELMRGGIPDGLLVCHHCDNPPCCNPGHLFVGTIADNTHDMIAKGRDRPPYRGMTHCVKGHALTPDNVYVNPRATSRQGKWVGEARTCLTCQRARNKVHYANTLGKQRRLRREARRTSQGAA